MKRLGVGIIGCGNISETYLELGPMFRALDIRAVADLNAETALARAAQFDVRALSIPDLLAAEDIDIVVNLTIPEAHFAVTKSILEAGKNAYTEKPLVLTLEEGKALSDLAKTMDLRIGSAPDTFLGGAHQKARMALDGGLIGKVTSGTAHVMGPGMEDWHPNPDFFFKPGAGPILDIGPYYITNLIQLLGPVARVVALTSSAQEYRTIASQPRAGEKIKVETPTNIHALLEFEQGATITLSASWDVVSHRHGHMELYGSFGSLFLPDPNFFGGTVEFANAHGNLEDLPDWDHPFGVENQQHGDGGKANYRAAGLAEMAEAMIANRPHRCSMDLALHAVDVMTSILKSGEIGGFVAMSTTCERPKPLGPSEASELLDEPTVAATA